MVLVAWIVAPICMAHAASCEQAAPCCPSVEMKCAQDLSRAGRADEMPLPKNVSLLPLPVGAALLPDSPRQAGIRPADPDARAFDLPLYLKNHAFLN